MPSATISECAACAATLGGGSSETCNNCGLWWVNRHTDHRGCAQPLSEQVTPHVKIELRESASPGCLLVLILFVLAGWGGAWVILSGFRDVPVSEGWFGVFVSLPLGAVVGGYSAAALLQYLLRQLFPSQLVGESDFVYVRVFRTWNGLLSGFRKSNARLARNEVVGVSFGEAQGGHSQLFLAHRDGYDCYAGFTGTREQAESYGREILRWLNAHTQ